MMSMAELFYGENEPTWVLGNSSHIPVSAYMQRDRDYEIPSYTDRHYYYPGNRYMQPAAAHDYEMIPGAYTDHRQYYTANRYMQPVAARDYRNLPSAYTDSQYTASRYMQPAAPRDHHEMIPTYTDASQSRASSQYNMQPAARDHHDQVHRQYAHTDTRHDQLVQSSARGHEALVPMTYTDRRSMSPHLQYSAAGRADEVQQQVTPPANRHLSARQAAEVLPATNTANQNSSRQYSMSSSTVDPSSRTSQQLSLSNQTGSRHKTSLPTRLELRVPLCCERCEERVKESLMDMDGVEGVLCDQSNQRVTVTGDVQPQKVLKRVKKIKKRSELWIRDSRTTSVQQSGTTTTGHRSSSRNTYA
ncbi:hypothetical protein CY35_13G050500 [Sphagnum magellanicum]|nr:hypothetical protein CY35_13G050500 [Sphagnum magellanicum]KAH9543192.1 hypothetical protein CY35_13G050500 [Sphagnum magellanicum]